MVRSRRSRQTRVQISAPPLLTYVVLGKQCNQPSTLLDRIVIVVNVYFWLVETMIEVIYIK